MDLEPGNDCGHRQWGSVTVGRPLQDFHCQFFPAFQTAANSVFFTLDREGLRGDCWCWSQFYPDSHWLLGN